MPQFDVFALRTDKTLVVDVQSDLLEPLNTRVVVPLIPQDSGLVPAKRLNPVFTIKGEAMIFAAQFLAAIQMSELAAPIENISDHKDEITAALDMLYQGF